MSFTSLTFRGYMRTFPRVIERVRKTKRLIQVTCKEGLKTNNKKPNMLFECYAYNIDCQHQHKSSCCLVRLSARTGVYKCWTIKWLLLKLFVTLWPLEVSPLANTHTVQNAFIKLTCNTAKKASTASKLFPKKPKHNFHFQATRKKMPTNEKLS